MLLTSCWKLFSFLWYLDFVLTYLVMLENSLIRKIRLISKFFMSQNGKQILTIHTLPNVPKRATECMLSLKMLFLKKPYTHGIEPSPRPFYKRSKLKESLDQQPEVLYRNVIQKCYVQVKAFQNILNLSCWPLVFTLCKDNF